MLLKLLALDRTADRFSDEVLRLIGAEASFTARVLGAANSAESAPASPITTLRAAITRIGSARAVDLVTAGAVTRVFVPREPMEKALWRHSLQVAVAASALARAARDPEVPPAEVYPAALLHDVGRVVMFLEAPELLRLVDEGDWDSPELLIAAEREICGVTHPELGAVACQQWGLPESIVHAVRVHHDPLAGRAATRTGKLVALVQLADLAMFPSALPGTPGWDEAGEALVKKVLLPKLPSFVHLDAAQLHDLIGAAVGQSEMTARALGFGEDPSAA
ncbi:MAG: HDOD domain-containing protein [Deltaproteobacteria bacterium]|nr:HDOD domain-containing protein [Deltaproteobacteria bacterium]MCB9785667.1 HDOD domain-containing protein [Deltaproteobacteria bacterium]